MYESYDRAGPGRMITTALVVVGIAVVVVLALWLILGSVLATPARMSVTESEMPTSSPEPTPTPEIAETTEAVPIPEPAPAPTPVPTPTENLGVVCIDPGHQGKGDSSHEPIGPGASETKPRVAGGTRGVSTGIPESELTLAVALKLRDELEKRGVTVVMCRETQDVNISNSERAAVANNANADLFIRLHADGVGSSSTNGISMLVPGQNQWTGPIMAESNKAGDLVLAAMLATTGAKNNGLVKRTDIAGFNWSKVPVILPEMGFMTNSTEDKNMATDEYRQKLAVGMADGIVEYLKSP